ncbi:MAG: hypothetical protein ACRDL6_05250 [Solirubrobacterales bacterium]
MSLAIVALLALVLGANGPAPAKQAAAGVDKLAARSCAKERKESGRRAFERKYGEADAMRACAKRARRKVRAATREADRLCQEELAALGPEEFAEEWGAEESGSDAIAECVAYTLDSLLQPESEEDEREGDDEEELA